MKICLHASILFAFCSSVALAQLEPTYEAHGGLPLWQKYRTVEFDHVWESPRRVLRDQQTFDLRSREGLIRGENYTIGAHNGQVWLKGDPAALGGMPPRFYLWTPFYFFAMPFVFADQGAVLQPLGERTVGGTVYDAIKVTFKPGTGDSPEDYYIAHLNKNSGQLAVVAYVVTYPSLRKGRPVEALEPHALVFDEWQTAAGLSVPRRARFFNWVNDDISGEPIGTMEFSNVHFSGEPPAPDRFQKPDGAVIAPLGES